jgi:hypothetical protein
MHRISQRLALLCGSLCLALGLLLVLVSNLSSSYLLDQQGATFTRDLAQQLATQVAPVVASGDLVRLEATLRGLRERHSLQQIVVTDLEGRPLGQSGTELAADSHHSTAQVEIDGNIAGDLSLARAPDPALQELDGMAFGLLVLAVLGSIFAAVLAGRWGQRLGARIESLREKLSDRPGGDDELADLELAVSDLPLDILAPPDGQDHRGTDFEEAGLLFVRLASLARYVETLDEQSLLDYTEAQRKLIESVATLYGGSLSVAREFGVLVQFGGSHSTGSPGFRALSAAWLLQQLAAELDANRRLSYRLDLACGLGEASSDSLRDIYPALYNQHIIDELAAHSDGEHIAVSPTLAAVDDVASRCQLAGGDGYQRLGGFSDKDLLERQRELLARELG